MRQRTLRRVMPSDEPALSPSPELVSRFLDNVRGTVPLGIEQLDVLLRLIEATGRRVEEFLDLGCANAVLSPEPSLANTPRAWNVGRTLRADVRRGTRPTNGPTPTALNSFRIDFHSAGMGARRCSSGGLRCYRLSGFALHGRAGRTETRNSTAELLTLLKTGRNLHPT
jgi:hypothetical protein